MAKRKFLWDWGDGKNVQSDTVNPSDVEGCPIGAIMTMGVNVNPAASLNYGTWALKGSDVWKLTLNGSVNVTVWHWQRTA